MTGTDLARAGFAIENEWYWRITENAQTFDVVAAVRDFLAPLARFARGRLAIADIATDVDELSFLLGDLPVAIAIHAGVRDRAAVNQFVTDLDRAFAEAGTAERFALVVPRRYELRGVLVSEHELFALAGSPVLLAPSGWT